MHVALVLGLSIIGVGAVLYLHHRLTEKSASGQFPAADSEDNSLSINNEGKENTSVSPSQQDAAECCGLHIFCERDSLSPVFSDIIEYFDDEELDAFIDRVADDYTPEEIECFRDVLLTLQPDDIAPWARSIQQRGIELPTEVRDELFIMVEEARISRLMPDS